MNYIYDIVLNFNDVYYEFYEWNTKDKIEYIKKIPIIRVCNDVIEDFKYSDICINNKLLNKLNENTEVYKEVGIAIVSNMLLLSSLNETIAVIFDKKGRVIQKSSLLINEEEDVINFVYNIDEISINYEKNNKINKDLTRRESYMIKYINNELKLIKEENNISKIKYIYFELFDNIDNVNNMFVKISQIINDNPKKIYDLLVLCKGVSKRY